MAYLGWNGKPKVSRTIQSQNRRVDKAREHLEKSQAEVKACYDIICHEGNDEQLLSKLIHIMNLLEECSSEIIRFYRIG